MFDPKKIMDMMQKAQGFQSQMQDQLKNKIVKGVAGGGMVEVEMNGAFEINSVKIDPSAVKLEDIELLQDMIKAAVNDAAINAKGLLTQNLKDFTGKFGLNMDKK